MKRWLVVFITLSLLLPVILTACGGDGEEKTPTVVPTATPGSTPTATATPTETSSPTPSGPVKIGGIGPWSGAAAISGLAFADPTVKLVEWQVKQMGGILGGRELKVVKYDNRAAVAEAVAGATKLITDDKVSALVWGGISKAEQDAVSDVAEANNVLFVTMGTFSNVNAKDTLCATFDRPALIKPVMDVITRVVKAKTVAFLAADTSDGRSRVTDYKAGLGQAGVKTVYEDYAPLEALDFSPYLTKIKYSNPDALVLDTGQNEFVISVAKQIVELGGWGTIKVVTNPTGSAALKLPGADGWYVEAVWLPGASNAASQKFVEDYQSVNGSAPTPNHIYYYNCLWIATKAIEFAGSSDPAKVTEAVQSGNLVVDTPMGVARFTKESKGYGGLFPLMSQIQGGKLVQVIIP